VRSPAARDEERAIRVAIACALFGAVAKLAAGIVTSSMSMISSAIDSLGDLFVSGANLFAVRFAAQPPDEEHNYGHQKVEGLAAMFEGGFIFAAGVFIVYEAIHKALLGEVSRNSGLGIAVMIPVLGATVATVLYLRKVARETTNLVVHADSVHYMTDVWVNVGVLVALVLVKVTGWPLIDTIISIGIALFMIRSSVSVLRNGFDLVMDRSLSPDVVQGLREYLGACARIDSFHDFKTRQADVPYVDFHVVVAPEMTARELHDVFIELREGVRRIAGPNAHVLMHADPRVSPSFEAPPSRDGSIVASAVESHGGVAHD
jgi:cation diffusion facilitator family transporter